MAHGIPKPSVGKLLPGASGRGSRVRGGGTAPAGVAGKLDHSQNGNPDAVQERYARTQAPGMLRKALNKSKSTGLKP